ncbi:MAG TPA: 50S ribosomal protein L11 methyltransferase [Ruminiclostridium sp.]|nr:50S ribosomal protein L11 methyltransferase [Ruminiclostridium sp.]
MNFIVITVYTTHAGIEPVTGRLYTLGLNGVEIEDKEDFDEFLAENTPNWDYVDESVAKKMSGETKVKAYVADNESGRETIECIKESIDQLKNLDSEQEFGRLEIELSSTSEEDWANNWKQYYKPTHIGRHVVIVPEWEEFQPESGDAVVKMNPGAAFGTGTHESTRLCIEFVEEFANKNTRMLDIGTGSGILAVTALKLGAKSAVGIDIDELAAKVAYENAELNGVETKFISRKGNLAENVEGAFNLITANIVADVIIKLAPDVPKHLALGGIFVASGIISSREKEVRDILAENGLYVFNSKCEKNWVALACKKK